MRYLITMLIVCGATIIAAGQVSPTDAALRQAAQDGQMTAVKELLAKGANVNARDEAGRTPLLWVAPARDNPEMVKFLIAKGADVNAKDNEGETALMIAASQSNPGIVTVLLEAGADVNAQNSVGGTALMSAAYRANIEEIKILLAHNADRTISDKKCRTALAVAAEGSKNYDDDLNRERFAEALKLLEVPTSEPSLKVSTTCVSRWIKQSPSRDVCLAHLLTQVVLTS
ncbi:MAG: Notch 1 [Blastocatellia bacterium]|nr:Notch 1 [Blastocatellia bacterium]